ncbi:hypothetical protein CCYS_12505 [Corynebacterium cystitidis DSM 20524]|uniref:Uncharacterized protein n=1 Tax=Corynebacterium cystitidis DSM 20524 TaxID=1121357 RepID=A0A1H9WG47_9CORY|nr:hypothetical protein CCYS_12505 [Corynebacterium cystitidis DSM 20524]SES32814.1 hypothetical protein SAMN05661109_02718 [Corynebacterium cystitidis DSM 20524]SNV62327.1 Uncharacterised protein [Corynebacterium cystitidis]
MAQPGRTLLRDLDDQGHPQSSIHLSKTLRNHHPRMDRQTKHQPTTIHMGRRRRIHPQKDRTRPPHPPRRYKQTTTRHLIKGHYTRHQPRESRGVCRHRHTTVVAQGNQKHYVADCYQSLPKFTRSACTSTIRYDGSHPHASLLTWIITRLQRLRIFTPPHTNHNQNHDEKSGLAKDTATVSRFIAQHSCCANEMSVRDYPNHKHLSQRELRNDFGKALQL